MMNSAARRIVRPLELFVAVLSGRHGNRWMYLSLLLSSLGISLTVALGIWYLETRRPLTEVPGVLRQLPGNASPVAPPFLLAIYGLAAPLGVAVSPDGQWIYATDRDGPRLVHVYDRAGTEVGTLAPPQTEVDKWNPLYLAVGPDGSLYVSDQVNRTVQLFGPDGAYKGALRPSELVDEGWLPAALAVAPSGDLYVTDFAEGKHRVVVLDASGALKAQYGREGDGVGELTYPTGLAVDGTGLVYVSDSNNSRVQLLDPQAGSLDVVASMQGLNLPRGLAAVGDRLYLADTIGQRVLAYELAKDEVRFLYTLGGEGLAGGMFRYPEGLAADQTGRVYVADRANNRIQAFGYR